MDRMRVLNTGSGGNTSHPVNPVRPVQTPPYFGVATTGVAGAGAVTGVAVASAGVGAGATVPWPPPR